MKTKHVAQPPSAVPTDPKPRRPPMGGYPPPDAPVIPSAPVVTSASVIPSPSPEVIPSPSTSLRVNSASNLVPADTDAGGNH